MSNQWSAPASDSPAATHGDVAARWATRSMVLGGLAGVITLPQGMMSPLVLVSVAVGVQQGQDSPLPLQIMFAYVALSVAFCVLSWVLFTAGLGLRQGRPWGLRLLRGWAIGGLAFWGAASLSSLLFLTVSAAELGLHPEVSMLSYVIAGNIWSGVFAILPSVVLWDLTRSAR